MCTVDRQKRALEAMEKRARADLDTLTAMIAARRSPPLESLRDELETHVLNIVILRREHAEHFEDPSRTPMPKRTPSQEMSAVKGISERTAAILEEGKKP